MSFSTTLPRADYLGTGTTPTYDFGFRIFEEGDLKVTQADASGNETQLVWPADFTVEGVGDFNGGNITLAAGNLPPGHALTIRFGGETKQPVDLRNQGGFFLEAIEDAIDRIGRYVQKVEDVVARSLHLKETEAGTPTNAILPSADERASKYLGFDAAGDPIALSAPAGTALVSAYMETVLDDANAAAARTTLGAAPLNSPAFTGTPSLPTGTVAVTQAAADGTTKVATTAFVQQEMTSGHAAQDVLHPRVPVRQTVLTGAVDVNGQASWITAGSGLTINYVAATTPVVIASSAGYDASGEVNQLVRLTADAANQFGGLPASTTSFLYADRATASTIVGANTLIPPQYGDVYDQKQNVLLHCNGADAATTITDDYGNAWTLAGNAQLDTAQLKFGSASLLLDGTGDYAEWAPTQPATFTQQGYGWTIEGWVRFNVLPTVGQQMCLFNLGQPSTSFGAIVELYNNAGVLKLQVYLSSNGTSYDIINPATGTNTTWATGIWYHIALVCDPLAGKYFLYRDGAQDISVTSSTPVAQVAKVRLGHRIDGTAIYLNGWMDEMRFSPGVRYPNGTTFTPAAAAFTPEGHFFSIAEMKMYEVTAASGTAGVNPTMTNRATRVFVGEADAGAATVTAVRAYAYRGRYVSPDAAIPASTVNTLIQTNLGVIPLTVPKLFMRCYTKDALAYPPGTVLKPSDQGASAFYHDNPPAAETRCSLTWTKGSFASSALVSFVRGSGVSAICGAGTWKYFVVVERGW